MQIWLKLSSMPLIGLLGWNNFSFSLPNLFYFILFFFPRGFVLTSFCSCFSTGSTEAKSRSRRAIPSVGEPTFSLHPPARFLRGQCLSGRNVSFRFVSLFFFPFFFHFFFCLPFFSLDVYRYMAQLRRQSMQVE